MHLVAKQIKGHTYFYLIEKAWRDGRPVTARTVYIGDKKKLAWTLEKGLTEALPQYFEQQEIGATLALSQVAKSLGLESLIDEAVEPRAGFGQVGRRLLVAALHHVLANGWATFAGVKLKAPRQSDGLLTAGRGRAASPDPRHRRREAGDRSLVARRPGGLDLPV